MALADYWHFIVTDNCGVASTSLEGSPEGYKYSSLMIKRCRSRSSAAWRSRVKGARSPCEQVDN